MKHYIGMKSKVDNASKWAIVEAETMDKAFDVAAEQYPEYKPISGFLLSPDGPYHVL